MASKKICIDAGHYGKYNRSPAVPSYYESDMAWKLHLLLKKYLEEYGFTVITTRANQANDLALETRGGKSKGCDLFLSIHSNAVGSAVNEGVDYPLACCCVSGKADELGLQLAQCIHSVMGTSQNGRIMNRKLSSGKDYYGVLRGAANVGVTGILLEHSFHTNTKATNWLLIDSNLDKLAKAEAGVIAKYFGAEKAPEIKPLSDDACKLYIGYASSGDVNTMTKLIKNDLGINVASANGYITTDLVTKGDQIKILTKCKELGINCVIYKETVVATPSVSTKGLQATSLLDMSQAQIIEKIGSLFTADQKKTGVLASVSLAQFLVESSYGKSELAQNANNCFGMKQNLSGNTWAGSTWDGVSIYNKVTKEHTGTEYIDLVRPFRKYACIEDSIEDHSAYLIGAKNGSKLRYEGLKGETDYRKAITIIKNGGYATSPTYIETLCGVVEKWNLTRFDSSVNNATDKDMGNNEIVNTPSQKGLYRVRKTWADASSQIGAYANLENAKAACKNGYYVFDEKGNVVYPDEFKSYLVKVICKELNIRKTPKWDKSDIVGTIKNGGVYTIIDETMLDGTKFGLLKSSIRNGVNYRDRWISLGSAYVSKM